MREVSDVLLTSKASTGYATASVKKSFFSSNCLVHNNGIITRQIRMAQVKSHVIPAYKKLQNSVRMTRQTFKTHYQQWVRSSFSYPRKTSLMHNFHAIITIFIFFSKPAISLPEPVEVVQVRRQKTLFCEIEPHL